VVGPYLELGTKCKCMCWWALSCATGYMVLHVTLWFCLSAAYQVVHSETGEIWWNNCMDKQGGRAFPFPYFNLSRARWTEGWYSF